MTKKSDEELRILMELRRSNAASFVPSKKLYVRKKKTPKLSVEDGIIEL
jgi:hypothetical protein